MYLLEVLLIVIIGVILLNSPYIRTYWLKPEISIVEFILTLVLSWFIMAHIW